MLLSAGGVAVPAAVLLGSGGVCVGQHLRHLRNGGARSRTVEYEAAQIFVEELPCLLRQLVCVREHGQGVPVSARPRQKRESPDQLVFAISLAYRGDLLRADEPTEKLGEL